MRGFAYDILDDGHRRFNLGTWHDALGLTPMIATPSFRVFFMLWRAPHVMFATLDDAPFFFLFVGLVRALIGRKTVGIFMRPHACFHQHHWKYRLKWLYFRILRALPRLAVISMVPYFVNPRFREVSRDWIYDPQNWDLALAPPDLGRTTDLSEQILAHARGRKIIAAIGGLNLFKGFDYAARIVSSPRFDPERLVFVACGPLAHDCHEVKADIEKAGGFVVGSFITDADIAAIYGISDMVWTCYPPRNDQASGIFGRASQLGVPVIVREGSFNAMQAERMGAPSVAIPWKAPEKAAELIAAAPVSRKEPDWDLVNGLRSESIARLEAYL